MADRRQFERVQLYDPVPGRVGTIDVYIMDVSLEGLRVAHQRPLGVSGSVHPVQFQWQGASARLQCAIVRTELQRVGHASFSKTLYHSALKISPPGHVPAILREIVQSLVMRALDEQKANARGVPAVAAQSFQTGAGTEYVRHELVSGTWKASPTTDPTQAKGGFTISAEETSEGVAMLRDAYEKSDFEYRQLIRKMAELSISQAEGVSTRRYTP